MFLGESNRRRNKISVDKGTEFYNRSSKSWLQQNDTDMHSTCKNQKFVIAEIFIRTLKNKAFKYMASVSKICTLINIIVQSNQSLFM